ncbi:MAG: type II toxin-antitoxin system VapC family toxin [Thermomicrobiales bacterium]
MIVDSSAIICILKNEVGWERLFEIMYATANLSMSATNYFECCQVIDSKQDPVFSQKLNELLLRLHVTIVSLTVPQVEIARIAFQTYGKGINSKSKLNHCDCIAYALAKETGEPLLFVGNDFIHTDIIPALDPPILSPE